MVDGQAREGRFVSDLSYAAYARAAQLEALAEYAAAERAYLEAARFDPESAGIWTRVGSVRCAGGQRDAAGAFDTAEHLDPEFAALWYERARCSLRHGQAEQAKEQALRALELDPSHLPTTKVVIDAALLLKQIDEARRYLDAVVAQHPRLPIVQNWRRALWPAVTGYAPSPQAVLDSALLEEEPEVARAIALEQGISESDVAARRVALGQPKIGLQQANQVREADPSDGTAWATVLASADLTGNEELFDRALHELDDDATLPNGLGVVLLAEVLQRRVGEDAARAWLNAAPNDEANDPLLAQKRSRLEQELNGTKKNGE